MATRKPKAPVEEKKESAAVLKLKAKRKAYNEKAAGNAESEATQ